MFTLIITLWVIAIAVVLFWLLSLFRDGAKREKAYQEMFLREFGETEKQPVKVGK